MKFSDIFKIGSGLPAAVDLVKGGLAIDIVGMKMYSKNALGQIFRLGTDLTEVQNSGFLTPIGGIIMFSGTIADLPGHWRLCNGLHGTPNLSSRFIRGTVSQSAIGDTGGSNHAVVVAHTHTQSAHGHTGGTSGEGAHTHHAIDPSGSGNQTQTTGLKYQRSTDYTANHTNVDKLTTAGGHIHTLNISNSTPSIHSTGVPGGDKNLPPYYTLAYIMRVS